MGTLKLSPKMQGEYDARQNQGFLATTSDSPLSYIAGYSWIVHKISAIIRPRR